MTFKSSTGVLSGFFGSATCSSTAATCDSEYYGLIITGVGYFSGNTVKTLITFSVRDTAGALSALQTPITFRVS